MRSARPEWLNEKTPATRSCAATAPAMPYRQLGSPRELKNPAIVRGSRHDPSTCPHTHCLTARLLTMDYGVQWSQCGHPMTVETPHARNADHPTVLIQKPSHYVTLERDTSSWLSLATALERFTRALDAILIIGAV